MKRSDYMAIKAIAAEILSLHTRGGTPSQAAVAWAEKTVAQAAPEHKRLGGTQLQILALFDAPRPLGLSCREIREITGLSESRASNSLYLLTRYGCLFMLRGKLRDSRYFTSEAALDAARPSVEALDTSDRLRSLAQRAEMARAARSAKAEAKRAAAPKPIKVAKPKPLSPKRSAFVHSKKDQPVLKHDKPVRPAAGSVFIPDHVKVQRAPTPKGRFEVDGPVVGGFLTQWKTLRGEGD